jgi:hypothetical protein
VGQIGSNQTGGGVYNTAALLLESYNFDVLLFASVDDPFSGSGGFPYAARPSGLALAIIAAICSAKITAELTAG